MDKDLLPPVTSLSIYPSIFRVFFVSFSSMVMISLCQVFSVNIQYIMIFFLLLLPYG